MRRAEELQDWICQVTEQVNDGEHLSVMLQDGQMLCMLANAIDPLANIKVNKLNTVFHSKANIRLFAEWCKSKGLRDADVFQPDDLMDGHDFVAVLTTLSLLFDKFGGMTYGDSAYDSDSGAGGHSGGHGAGNPVSDSESHTSSGSSHGVASPKKKANGSSNKLTAFMKGNFFSKKKKPTTASPPADEGTPPMSPSTPPPMSPTFEAATTPPMSPQHDSPSPPPSPPRQQSRTLSGGANNSRLNAFLTQVPPSREAPLEHVSKPAGPPKRAPSRKENKPVNIPPSPATPPPREIQKPVLGVPQPVSVANDARSKFAAFMKTNPPAPVAAAPSTGATPASNLSAFMKAVPPTVATISSSSNVSTATPAPTPAPALERTRQNSFAKRKAVFSPKSAAKASTFSNTPALVKSSRSPSTEANKLKDFMMKQPSSSAATKTRSDSSQNKLAAFLASTNIAPSISDAHVETRKKAPSISSFNPYAGKQQAPPSRKASLAAAPAPVTFTPAPAQSSRFPFTPRKQVERSTGRGNYLRKRGTYFAARGRRGGQSKFSLEAKRAKFMNEQLLIKEEQLRRQAAGSASAKQNLIVPGVQCYVPDRDEVWLLTEIVEYNERTKMVTVDASLDDGTTERRVIDLKDSETIRAVAGPSATEIESLPVAILQDNPSGVEDMRLLRYLNEPSILFNLKQRFEASKPCTLCYYLSTA